MSKLRQPKTIDERIALIRERLAEARRLSKLTQTTVADAMGLSNSQYSRIEGGSTEMTLRQFLVVCEELRLDPAEVLGEQPEARVSTLQARLRASETKLDAITRLLRSDKDVWE